MAVLSLLHAGAHPGLTAFFSLHYLGLFLPAAVLLFSLTPNKGKKYALLVLSLGFYWLISGVLIGYLFASVAVLWGCGLWMNALQKKRDIAVKAAEKPDRKAIKKKYNGYCRMIMGLAVAAHIALILVLKYSGFFMMNVNALFGTGFAVPEYLKPLGISFFILQSVSYLVDVYRQTIPADGNPLRLLLFVSFFPQIVEGPICRYGQTAQQLWEVQPIRYENLTAGLQRILWGLMKKLVVADRLNPFVEELFSHHAGYPGWLSLLGAVLYTVQLYMDFSGSMDAVCGTAQIFGITMPENFRRPFFSKSISEFWNRWHITLGTWFRDYIFYPVTMSGPMKKLTGSARKKLGNHFGPLLAGSVALFCVWFSNGLWHGAAWHYIFFGLYHFVLILMGNCFAPYLKKANERLGITPENKPFRVFQMLRTSLLVVFGELIFRAENMAQAGGMLKAIFTDFGPLRGCYSTLKTALEASGCDVLDLLITAVAVCVVLVVSILQETGVEIRGSLNRKPTALRWAVWYALILFILIFGAYGVGYIPVDPMYANF